MKANESSHLCRLMIFVEPSSLDEMNLMDVKRNLIKTDS